ncbi:MAG: XylR N-terminal domain-containing protein [Betaproteobacteria bacterium]|nr:XylR N-terminal domain-containing protein [Betaproteobacteria bacterium]
MVLMHTSALGSLRGLVGSVGKEHARRLLTRMGYTSGVRDAELAMRIRGEKSLRDAFFTGPQLHMLEGIVRVTPIRMEMDVQSGHFAGEFLWENSWEQDTHIREMGQSDEPVCWSQIGYASGYTSAFMGRFILFKEVECVACGHNNCRIVGKPLEEWEDAEQHAGYFSPTRCSTICWNCGIRSTTCGRPFPSKPRRPQLVGTSKASNTPMIW